MFHVEVLEDNLSVDDISEEISKIKTACGFKLDWTKIPLQSADGSPNPPDNLPENYYNKTFFDLAKNINRIIDKYGLCKTELQKLKPGECTSTSRALSKNVFIPILHPKGSFTWIDDNIFTFEVGKVYLVNTTLSYSLINAGHSPRVEIVGRMYS